MAAQNVPAAEVDVTEAMVRRLLAEQHPDLVERPLTLVANGWDNVIFRLGDDVVVRLPRREMAAGLVLHEQRWLPELAVRLPIPIPAPIRSGVPSEEYPWNWSICSWFDGSVAADVTLGHPAVEAVRLGQFLAALHVPAPDDAPHNPYRAHPICQLPERFEPRLEQLVGVIDVAAVRSLFERLIDVDEFDRAPCWVHGDLHTANVLVDRDSIAAVIDWGDITAGDPAVDFAIGWMLFGDEDRARFRSAAGGVDDAMWRRAEVWALHFAVMYVAHSADSPRFQRMGAGLLERLLAG